MAAKQYSIIAYILLLMLSITVSILSNKLVLCVIPIAFLCAIYLYFNMSKFIYLLVLFMPCIEILNQCGVGIQTASFQLMLNSLISSFFIIVAFFYLIKRNADIKIYKSSFFTVLIYILFGLVSTLVAVEKMSSIKEEIKLVFYFSFILVIPFIIKNKADKAKVIELFLASSIVPVIIGIIQFLTNTSPIMTYLDGHMVIRITGGFTHSNHFAYYLSMIGIILFFQLISKEKVLYFKLKILWFLIVFLELFLTYSRTALIIFVLVLVLILLSKGKSKQVLLLATLAILGSIIIAGSEESSMISERFDGVFNIFNDKSYIKDAMNNNYSDSFGWRIYLWTQTVSLLFQNNILFGFGLQSFNTVAEQAIGIYIDSHNTFVKVLVEMGIVGLISFLLFVLQLFVTYFKSKKKNSDTHVSSSIYIYIYVLLVSFVDPVFSHIVIGFYIWLFFGMESTISVSNKPQIKMAEKPVRRGMYERA